MKESANLEKIVFLLRELYKKNPELSNIVDLVTFSEFEFEDHWNKTLAPVWIVYNLSIHTQYDVYFKNYKEVNSITEIIKTDIEKISTIYIDEIKIVPDYNKIEVTNSEIHPVYTNWEEINNGQIKLLNLLKTSSDSLDFQNIGNTSRTILQKLAKIVFDPAKHRPADKTIDTRGDKYKNQLHTYIKGELSGETNKELRHFAEASINALETAIDLASTVTHKLEMERPIAEVCVIGTIGAISIVKFVESQKK
jgi:hypothetical protein